MTFQASQEGQRQTVLRLDHELDPAADVRHLPGTATQARPFSRARVFFAKSNGNAELRLNEILKH